MTLSPSTTVRFRIEKPHLSYSTSRIGISLGSLRKVMGLAAVPLRANWTPCHSSAGLPSKYVPGHHFLIFRR
jgi:hypothetical protein